jgi:hypothetical protein
MLDPPYEVVSCSWPLPVSHENGRWTSDPEWDAPASRQLPQPRWEIVEDQPCFLIDWRDTFRRGVRYPSNSVCGEMCGFHVVFEIRVAADGVLSFWDDDGSIIRRNGVTLHCARASRAPSRREISVTHGERLQIAQWQLNGDWHWGATLDPVSGLAARRECLLRYRNAVQDRLARPDGPPLKMFVQAGAPLRTVVAAYSMILNGYSPSAVILFGEHQWNDAARAFLQSALPFAEIRCTEELLRSLRAIGGKDLAKLAAQHWFVLKICAAMLSAPSEFCLMDDDVFVLDSAGDALERFRECDAVFTPDTNHGQAYLSVWGDIFGNSALPTERMNTGLVWLRVWQDRTDIAQLLLRGRERADIGAWAWEQGFVANCFARNKVHQLASQRYLCALWDGLPGGVLGYDYFANPCRFASVHYAGLYNKPCDAASAFLAPHILDRRRGIAS